MDDLSHIQFIFNFLQFLEPNERFILLQERQNIYQTKSRTPTKIKTPQYNRRRTNPYHKT